MSRTSFIVLIVAAFFQFGTAGFAQSLATVTFRLSDGEVCKPFSNLDCSDQPRVEVEIGFDNSNGLHALILEAQTVRLGEVSHQLFGHGSSLGKGPQFRQMYLNYRAPITFEERGDSGVRVRTVIKATRSGINPRRTSMTVSIADAAQWYQLQYLEVPAPSDICPSGTTPTLNAPSANVVAPRLRATVNVDDIPGWLDSRIADAINGKIFTPLSNAMGNLVLLGFGKPTVQFKADGGTDVGLRLTIPFRAEEESIVTGGLATALSYSAGTSTLQVLWGLLSSESNLQPKLDEFADRLVSTEPNWRISPGHLNWFCRSEDGDSKIP